MQSPEIKDAVGLFIQALATDCSTPGNHKSLGKEILLKLIIIIFKDITVAVALPFLGAGIAFMQLSVPNTKRSAAAPMGRGLL